MMVLHWRLTFLWQGQVCFRMGPIHLYGKNVENFKWPLLKPLGWCCSNFMWNFLGAGERRIAKMVVVHWWRWPPCPYKNLYRSSSPETNKPWGLIFAQSSGAGDLPKLLTWWSYVEVWPFYGKVKLASPCICMGPIHVYGKNVENSCFGHLLYNPVESKLDDEH